MKILTTPILILIGFTCYAQEKKETKKDTVSFTIEPATFKKLQQIEENWNNFNDPKWIKEQLGIIYMQYELIQTTLIESHKLDPNKVKARIANGKLYVEKLNP